MTNQGNPEPVEITIVFTQPDGSLKEQWFETTQETRTQIAQDFNNFINKDSPWARGSTYTMQLRDVERLLTLNFENVHYIY